MDTLPQEETPVKFNPEHADFLLEKVREIRDQQMDETAGRVPESDHEARTNRAAIKQAITTLRATRNDAGVSPRSLTDIVRHLAHVDHDVAAQAVATVLAWNKHGANAAEKVTHAAAEPKHPDSHHSHSGHVRHTERIPRGTNRPVHDHHAHPQHTPIGSGPRNVRE